MNSSTTSTPAPTATLSPLAAELIADFCTTGLYFPEATDCFEETLFSSFTQCSTYTPLFALVYAPWLLRLVIMPIFFGATPRQSVAAACMLANMTSPAAQPLVGEYCANTALLAIYYLAFQIFQPMSQLHPTAATTVAYFTGPFLTLFYFPLAIYALFATLSILRDVARTTPQFHLVYFFYAFSVAQFVGYICWMYETYLVFPVLFLPFCFVSPTFAINTELVAQALTGSSVGGESAFLQFPIAYVWCYQMLLLAAIAADRMVALFTPVRYKLFDNVFAKKGLKCLTLGFALISVLFISGVLVGVFWGYVPTTTAFPASIARQIDLSVAIFLIPFFAAPFMFYVCSALALAIGKCTMRHTASVVPTQAMTDHQKQEEEKRWKTNRDVATLVLSTCVLNIVVAFVQIFQLFYTSVCGGNGGPFSFLSCNNQAYLYYIYPLLPYAVDMGYVVNFMLQCFFSAMFRKAALKFAKSTFLWRAIVAARRRLGISAVVAIAPPVVVPSNGVPPSGSASVPQRNTRGSRQAQSTQGTSHV